MGIECFRVQFPRGQDANEFALKQQPATHWLGMYPKRAAWLGKGQRPTVALIEPQPVKPQQQTEEETIKPAAKEKLPEPVTPPQKRKTPESVPPLAAKAEEPTTAAKEKISEPITTTVSEEPDSSLAAQLPVAPLPTGTVVPVRDVRVEVSGETVYVTMGERRYRIVDLGKNTAPGVLHVNVMVTSTSTRGREHACTWTGSIYTARARARCSPSKRRKNSATRKRASSAIWRG